MSFQFKPAIREQVGLLVGLAGGTGSGKTYSAMRLASLPAAATASMAATLPALSMTTV